MDSVDPDESACSSASALFANTVILLQPVGKSGPMDDCDPAGPASAISQAPPLPALPELPDVSVVFEDHSHSDTDSEIKPSLDDIHSDSDSEVKPKKMKTSPIDDLFGDVFIIQIEPAKSIGQRVEQEMVLYQSESSIPLSSSPLTWWKEHELKYPLLSVLAKFYFGIPPQVNWYDIVNPVLSTYPTMFTKYNFRFSSF